MGGGSSRSASSYVYHPPQDTLFKQVACVGLTRDEYSTTHRLASAPFYSVFFTGTTYIEIYGKIIATLTAKASTQPQQQPMPGPVYLLTAIDKQTNIIQCYMYFPSINKTTMQKWRTYAEVGLYHSWMSRLLSNPLYSLKADTSCKRYTSDKYGMVYGCSTEDTDTKNMCMQDTKAHQRMGIYANNKKQFQYPSIYFSAKQINSADARVNTSIDASELMNNIIAANSEIYATDNALNPVRVSPSGTAKLVFTNTLFQIALVSGKVIFSRTLHGVYQTTGIVEDEYFKISSASGPSSSDDLIYALKITTQDAVQPIALVLNDDGSLVVIDRNNKISLAIGADGTLAPGIVESGIDAPSAVGDGDGNGNGGGHYDQVADFKMRLENLRGAIQQYQTNGQT